MNLRSIEEHFQKIEQRAKRVAEYFSPIRLGPKKHPYINEIKEDYLEDCKLYNINKYINTKRSIESSSLPPLKNEENFKKNSIKKLKQFMIPKRKQLKIDSMKEFKPELRYKGSFSITKLLPERKHPRVSLSMQLPKHIESWAQGISQESYAESVDYSNLSLDSELKQVKSYPENISSEYIKQSFSELAQFSSKNSRYELSPEELTGRPKKKKTDSDVVIKYQTDPNLIIRTEKHIVSVQICNISTLTFKEYDRIKAEDGFLTFNGSKKLNLDFEYGNIWGNVFEISLLKGKEKEVFFICFSKYSKEVEEKAFRSIHTYKDVQKASHNFDLKLPKINEKEKKLNKRDSKEFGNPITEALMKYRNKATAFNPESYLAKLSLFETHAYIREKYS